MQIKDYKVLEVKQIGENANVYLVQNLCNEKFILKHFTKAVKPFLGYGKHNHFGRRREGSNEVFQEIKTMSSKFPFLINFHERFKSDNKWCIVIEYFDGISISKYLSKNKDDDEKITRIIRKFADEVCLWHKNKFALGDAHLENVLINEQTEEIMLIDYGQIHHPSFKYCQKFNCYNPENKRLVNDLDNQTKYFGKGFITELAIHRNKHDIFTDTPNIFRERYYKTTAYS